MCGGSFGVFVKPQYEQFERVITDSREAVKRVERHALKAVEIASARGAYDARKEQGATVADLHALAAAGPTCPPQWRRI